MCLNHLGTTRLETDRLILKEDEKEDLNILWDNLFSDKDAVKRCKWKNFESKDDFLNRVQSLNLPKDVYAWTIWEKESSLPIGGISVHSQEDDKLFCKIGYSIHPNYWNKGYASEALKVVLDFMINEVGYRKVVTECLVDNAASKRVMEKANMNYEGEYIINDKPQYVYSKSR